MKIDITSGEPVIDASDLAELLDLAPREVRDKMRSGDIPSRFEIGEGADAGRFRLTFFNAGRRVRLTCSDDGTVLTRIRTSNGAT